MTGNRRYSDRARIAAWEGVCGLVMLIAGILSTRLNGVANPIGPGLMFLGIGGCGHAALCALGLASLPETEERRAERRKEDDVHN